MKVWSKLYSNSEKNIKEWNKVPDWGQSKKSTKSD